MELLCVLLGLHGNMLIVAELWTCVCCGVVTIVTLVRHNVVMQCDTGEGGGVAGHGSHNH